MPDGHKWCPDCATVKPLDQFVRNSGMASGRGPYCKPCHNIRGKAAKDKVGGSGTYHLKRRYGITAQDADAMLAQQGGVCAICRAAPAAHVDHDHESGAVRALLCFNCNGGLGQFRDDPTVLRAAADYVEQHRRPRTRSQPMRIHRPEVTARGTVRKAGARPWLARRPHLLCDRGRARLADPLA